METSSPQIPDPPSRRPGVGRAAARRSLIDRKRSERQAARRRIAVRTRQPLTSAQLAFDPWARPNRSPRRRLARFLAGLLASLLVHAGAVGVGVVLRSRISATTSDNVKIEVRQRPPQPPPEIKPPPPPPVEEPKKTPAKIVKAPPPPLPPPPTNIPKPIRVVGLSLESTTEGGSGPSFAVGNTRLGETAERAVAPKDVTAAPSAVPDLPGPHGSSKTNQAATRIPIAGMKYEPPKPRRHREPPFPPTLKSQGIEGDVTVMVFIDVAGKVTAVKILKESPYPEFNEAARAEALTDEYDPATKDGLPMPYQLSYTYRFRLEDK